MWMTLLFFYLYFQVTFSLKERSATCDDVEIVSRSEWRARPAIRSRSMKLPLNHVIIQHTVTPTCHTRPQCMRNILFIQDYHLDYKGWADIAYNFMIGGDGRVYEGIGWIETGAHSINFNTNSLGVAFIGDYSTVAPNQKMLDAALKLIQCGVEEGYLAPTREIHGHRDVACTASPGDKLYALIRQWSNYKGGLLALYDCSGY